MYRFQLQRIDLTENHAIGNWIAPFCFQAIVYEDNRIIENNIDSDVDDEIDRQEVFSYNPDGTVVTTTISSVTEGAIGSNTFVYQPGGCNNNSGNSPTRFYCVTIK